MKTIVTAALMLMLGSIPAWAALGQYELSVNLDQQTMQGKDRVEARTGYHFHEITTPDGGFVREYISPEGKVFGIAWHGHSMPNLDQLLGSYTTNLQQDQRQTANRRSVAVKNDRFVFFSHGHGRLFQGHAYVPSLIPSNLGPEVVQ